MRETWIVNASPLISLAKIGRLDLLRAAERDVLIPATVAEEILAGPAGDPASVALTVRDLPEPVPTASRVEVVEWGLGAGETAVLSLALDRGGTAVIDDREARAAARSRSPFDRYAWGRYSSAPGRSNSYGRVNDGRPAASGVSSRRRSSPPGVAAVRRRRLGP
jgi:hypothetical protein